MDIFFANVMMPEGVPSNLLLRMKITIDTTD